MIIFGVIILLTFVMTLLIVCRRKPRPPERRIIMPDESMDTAKDGNGANAFGNALDHPDSRYYTVNDFYNMKSGGSLHILSHFQTYQQTTEYTCGSAAALMVLNYYGNHEFNEMEIAERTKAHPGHGTSVEALADFLQEIGYRVAYHADTTPLFATLEDFRSYVIQQIDSGTPVMVDWVDWSGHWQTIIGIDTCGTDSPYDDVLIMADSYDVTDHYQDGYYIVPLARFFEMWREGPCTQNAKPYEQPFVTAYKD